MIRNSSNQDNIDLNSPIYPQLDSTHNSGDAITPQVTNNDSLGATSDYFIESEVVSEQLTEPTYYYSDRLNSSSIWNSSTTFSASDSTEAIDNNVDRFSMSDLFLADRDDSNVADKEISPAINYFDLGIEPENKGVGECIML